MQTTTTNQHYINLLKDMYGQELDPTQVTDVHLAVLGNIVQTKLTDAEQTVISHKYQYNSNDTFIANLVCMTVPKLRAFERDILTKLRSNILPAPMPIAIEATSMSPRAYNSLKRVNINTLDEISRRSDDELLTLRNIGQTSVTEIRACVHETLEKRASLYENNCVIDYKDIGICPVCNGTNHDATEIDNGYEESYYSVKCNDCGTTWNQRFHTVHVNDGYDNVFDSDGSLITVLVENRPRLNIDDVIRNAQLCCPCTASCDLNPDGICRYPLVYGRMPTINCRKGLTLK